MSKSLKKQVYVQVEDQIYNKVWDQVRGEVCDKIWLKFYYSLCLKNKVSRT
jgi:hypothetical protein